MSQISISHARNITAGICRDFDPEIFFTDEARAKTICSFCPVARECRDGARERAEAEGVFGGESADDRSQFLGLSAQEKFEYSAVRDLINLGVAINTVAERLGITHDAVTRNIRRHKARS